MAGTTAITYGNEELTVNQWERVRDLRRMNETPYPTVDKLLQNVDKMEGGEKTIVAWDVDDHSVATGIKTGYEGVMGFLQTTLQPGYQGHGIVVQPYFISSVDMDRNSGKAQIFDLQKQRIGNVEAHFRRQFNTVLWRTAIANGTHPGVAGWEDFLSLNGADSATGILEDQAVGGNTLHNYVKSAASPVQFHNFFADLAGDVSQFGLPALYAAGIDAEAKEGSPVESESEWYWSQNFAKHVKSTLRDREQWTTSGNMDDASRKAHAVYNGIPVRIVSELPTTGTATTAKKWSAVRVNWKKGVRFRAMPKWVLDWTPVVDLPGGVGVKYALIRLWGNLISLQPGACAVLVDGEAL